MAEETKKVETEEKTEIEEESTKCETEEKEGFNKEKLYGVAMVIAGIAIFAAIAIFYAGFIDLFIKGLVLGVAIAAIGLVILGIIFALYA